MWYAATLQGDFGAFLNAHFQPCPGGSSANNEGNAISAMYAVSSSQPGSPAHCLPVAGKSFSAELESTLPSVQHPPMVRRPHSSAALMAVAQNLSRCDPSHAVSYTRN